MSLDFIFKYDNNIIFDSRTSGNLFQSKIIGKLISSLEDEKKECENRIKTINTYLSELISWHEELMKKVCGNCDGHGQLRVIIAQDESKLETCNRCHGSGLKKDVK